MRLRSLFFADMRFQAKYGFYFLYAVLTIVYMVILFALPENWREKAAAILIFSDPAAMGLFFMGAIVLLEKSQYVPCAIAVSPVRSTEYIIAKAASLSVISLVVAAALALAANVDCLYDAQLYNVASYDASLCKVPSYIIHMFIILLGTVMASVIFTLLGIIVATKIVSLNQFILWTVPLEILCFVPAILHLFKLTPAWFRYYPINVCMDMISGHFPSAIGLLGVLTMMAVLFVLARVCVLKMWDRIGGIKL